MRATENDQAAVAALVRFSDAMTHALRSAALARPVFGNHKALLDYLGADMAHRTKECFRVLHLNSGNMLIGDEIMSEGTVDRSAVYIREILARACEIGSAGLILVHNHPSGDPTPSVADVKITRRIAAAAELMDLRLHDHLIVARSGYASLKRLGHL